MGYPPQCVLSAFAIVALPDLVVLRNTCTGLLFCGATEHLGAILVPNTASRAALSSLVLPCSAHRLAQMYSQINKG